jgi:hypothetical protein
MKGGIFPDSMGVEAHCLVQRRPLPAWLFVGSRAASAALGAFQDSNPAHCRSFAVKLPRKGEPLASDLRSKPVPQHHTKCELVMNQIFQTIGRRSADGFGSSFPAICQGTHRRSQHVAHDVMETSDSMSSQTTRAAVMGSLLPIVCARHAKQSHH